MLKSGFSMTVAAIYQKDGSEVAVKVMNEYVVGAPRPSLDTEASVSTTMMHPNIVQSLGAFHLVSYRGVGSRRRTNVKTHLIMEWCNGESLARGVVVFYVMRPVDEVNLPMASVKSALAYACTLVYNPNLSS